MKRRLATLPWIASRPAFGLAFALAIAVVLSLALRAVGTSTSHAAPPALGLAISSLNASSSAPSRGPALIDVADSDMIGIDNRDSEEKLEDERAGWVRRSPGPVTEDHACALLDSEGPRHDPLISTARRGRRFVWTRLSRGPPAA